LSLTRQLIFLLPFLLILPRHFGIKGVWASMASSDFLAFLVAAVTLVIMLRVFRRKMGTPGTPATH
ncbi:MAG: hypothetical protein K2K36_09395, partial [Muribaculaceae bacterium]|nr:hypothetical protein [Muribaculaceae bacterium]